MTLAAVAGLAGLSLTACGGGSSAADKGTITLAVPAAPKKWDPYTFDWGPMAQAEQAVYDTLIHTNTDGTPAPGLATSWKYTDPTHFEMKLRAGVKFSDGEALDAAAVKKNLDRAKKVVGPKTDQLDAVKSVEAAGTDTVKITLKEPYPSLPAAFQQVMGMVASPKALDNPESLDQDPVGAGPYTLDKSKTVPGDHYTYKKNPQYWDAKSVGVDTLVLKVIPDMTAALSALRSGQIDATLGSVSQLDTAKTLPNVKVLSQPSFFASLNLQDRNGTQVKALKDVRVRQAIQYAVDRAALQKVLGPGQPSTQLFLPGTPGYDASLNNAYPHDPAKAKQLLAAAGYPDGFDLPLVNTDYSNWTDYVQAVSSQLKEVGINVKIKNLPLPTYLEAKFKTDNPAYAWFYNASDNYFDVQYALLKDSKYNPYKVESPAIEKLAAKAASEQGEPQAATLKQLSKQFVTESPMVVTNVVDVFYFYDTKKIKKMEMTALQPLPSVDALQPAG
ncbi:ABC transporter substrate-binding protein [Spirillospora sp. CA-142024]|uniref:ABC transporter substrate-binding protein n=1 Tax=Spirillospora sp. CA-142024 TaxID=3240036 RepID=UPI003D8BCF16